MLSTLTVPPHAASHTAPPTLPQACLPPLYKHSAPPHNTPHSPRMSHHVSLTHSLTMSHSLTHSLTAPPSHSVTRQLSRCCWLSAPGSSACVVTLCARVCVCVCVCARMYICRDASTHHGCAHEVLLLCVRAAHAHHGAEGSQATWLMHALCMLLLLLLLLLHVGGVDCCSCSWFPSVCTSG